MNEGTVKTIISIISGTYAGGSYILSAGFDPWLTFGVALLKAFIIGACAWLGQTAAISIRKRILKAYKKYKEKIL